MLEQGWITRVPAAQSSGSADEPQAPDGWGNGWCASRGSAERPGDPGAGPAVELSRAGLWNFTIREALAAVLPRLFVDAFGALPLRLAAGKLLYLGFEERLDPVLALAVERMTGLRVECGLVQESLFRPAHARMLDARFSSGGTDRGRLRAGRWLRCWRDRVEQARPVESRLVRVHDCLWLRMWTRPQTRAAA